MTKKEGEHSRGKNTPEKGLKRKEMRVRGGKLMIQMCEENEDKEEKGMNDSRGEKVWRRKEEESGIILFTQTSVAGITSLRAWNSLPKHQNYT